MSDTPRTDVEMVKSCHENDGAFLAEDMMFFARDLERENTRLSEGFAPAINAIEIKARANEEAASRATEARDIAWSQGVAAGLRLALSELPNAQAQR